MLLTAGLVKSTYVLENEMTYVGLSSDVCFERSFDITNRSYLRTFLATKRFVKNDLAPEIVFVKKLGNVFCS